ncbi:MAG TPA: twin-arginine translocase TatA/TatE family subunit [Rhizomicrobium sp.]|jgi:sec-independent protein translocase protein TatA
MGALSIWHIVIIAAIALLLFGGRGKISDLMGDVAKGINSFKKGLKDGEDDHHTDASPRIIADRRDEKDPVQR